MIRNSQLCTVIKLQVEAVVTARSGQRRLRKVLFLALSVTNISGTAEKICNKFKRNTCLVPRSDSLKVSVKFGGLHAVYVWKNIFAPVVMVALCNRADHYIVAL